MTQDSENEALERLNLGLNLEKAGKVDEANQAWRIAIEEGKASGTDAGEEIAANAAFNLGLT